MGHKARRLRLLRLAIVETFLTIGASYTARALPT
jgi:hypothetical protein